MQRQATTVMFKQESDWDDIEVIDELNALLRILEAQAMAHQEGGAESLHALAPAVLNTIFWGIQRTATDCLALVGKLDLSLAERAGPARNRPAAALDH